MSILLIVLQASAYESTGMEKKYLLCIPFCALLADIKHSVVVSEGHVKLPKGSPAGPCYWLKL